LELLIVILLLSLFTFLVFGSMKRQASLPRHPKIPQIRELLGAERAGRARELVCIDNCEKCFFLDRQHRMEESGIHFPPLKAYLVDPFDQPIRIDFGRWRDHPVCLRIRSYTTGSIDRMILESGGAFYYLPAYFGEVRRFETLTRARDYWLRDQERFHDRGDYY
jgi:hypothetical protein